LKGFEIKLKSCLSFRDSSDDKSLDSKNWKDLFSNAELLFKLFNTLLFSRFLLSLIVFDFKNFERIFGLWFFLNLV
jgi:hypothetical protein